MNYFINNSLMFLNNFYNFAKKNWENPKDLTKVPFSEIFDENFRYLLKTSGYTGLPKIVSDTEYKNTNTDEYYRGATEYLHTARFLTEKDYRLGQGHMGGHFASPIFLLAADYAGNFKMVAKKEKKVLAFKLPSKNYIKTSELLEFLKAISYKTDVITTTEIKDKLAIFVYFLESIDDEFNKAKFFKLFSGDPAKLAVFLGFDYIIDDCIPGTPQIPNIDILNRGAMTVSKSEYDKFISKCFAKDPRANKQSEKI